MFRLEIFVFCTLVCCSAAATLPQPRILPELDGRIVGGSNAQISYFPWQVSIQMRGSHFCGGSIISSNIIVTAAHCLQGSIKAESLAVRAGSALWNSGGVLLPVLKFRNHEQYNSISNENDIALLLLGNRLQFSSSIKPIGLASTIMATEVPAVVSGWGTTKSGSAQLPYKLKFVELQLVQNKECSSPAFGYGSAVQESMICAYAVHKDACQGDSGGPLVAQGELVGVVSWGYGCAYPKYPGVYADVRKLRSWIERTMQSL